MNNNNLKKGFDVKNSHHSFSLFFTKVFLGVYIFSKALIELNIL